MNTLMKDSLQYKRYFLEQCIRAEFPKFELVDKRHSTLMKVISKVLFFNPNFMTKFITVIGNKVYVPSLPWKITNPYGAIEILCHEWVHMKDAKSMKFMFKFLYLFPQILVVLAPLGFWNPWFFLFALCILPLPSLGRSEIELRGYTMSMAVRWWLFEKEPNYEKYAKYFTSSAYYWMYPLKDSVIDDLECCFERIRRYNLKPHEQHIFDTIIGE